MKVRIEIDIGDKHIAEQIGLPDDVFKQCRFPSVYISDVNREIWDRMAEARERAITEFQASKGLNEITADILRRAYS